MSKKKLLPPFLMITILLQSCTIARISGKAAVPMLYNQPTEKVEIVEHITVKKNVNFDWTSTFEISEILADEIAEKKPDAVINTSVKVTTSVDNFFLNLITLGMAWSRKIVIEADFVKEAKN
ncbi:hypothetical protein HCG49_18070 [Arenibacter sp. 6A1]|uniref:hypothetical protein n=1 Tax=Arenibacter sp. 6A1 TaxID=2720391 RepID=UPI001447AB6E|nr:hypothetical protein [Arenibacter sp. 6A1]NKI28461.1 hypothetical protein [Arenibacter sp. 6A1]